MTRIDARRRGCAVVRPFALFLCGFVLCGAGAGRPVAVAADPPTREQLAGLVNEPILPAGLVNEEFRVWCEARIVPLAKFEAVDDWRAYAERIRSETLERVVLRGAPPEWRNRAPTIVWGDTLETGGGYRIRKLRYEALPGLWIPALLYVPEKLEERTAVALHVNGHDPDGKAAAYKQIRSINLAKRGLLVLNVEWLGMGQLRGPGYGHGRMNQLELAGVSGLAPFYLAMQRGLDVLLAQEHADPLRVAVSGLSGGGWQTIFLSALDPRVTLANPVAGYSSFFTRLAHHSDLGDSEQTPTDMAVLVDYAHLTAIRAPRPTLLTYNAKDNCCFAAAHALPPLLEAAEPVYRLFKAEANLKSHVNHEPGTHNYERENREAYYGFLADHFAPKGADWPRTEIECQAEVKTAAELNVELPEGNADFPSLAMKLAEGLPRNGAPPDDLAKLAEWRDKRRAALARVLRTPAFTLQARKTGDAEGAGVAATRWRLRLGDAWTVPAVELTPPGAREVAVVLADEGRRSTLDLIDAQVRLGRRVVAVDPFYLGESAFPQRPYLFALLAATVGDRPLGLQARQLQAIVQWAARGENAGGASSVTIVARGPRTCLATLAALALDDAPAVRGELHRSLGSLRQVLEQNWSYEQAPGCFTFGLLEQFDVRSLVELAAPREISFAGAGEDERLRREIAPVEAWYRRLGSEFSPLGAPAKP